MEEKTILSELADLKRLTLLAAKSVLNFEDAVMLTGLSRSSLYKKTSRKEVPHYRQGKLLYFSKDELQAWMLENRIATEAEIQSEALSYCATTPKY